MGSGAMFFDLAASGRLEGRRAFLTDSNADLVGCYRVVRDAPRAVLRHLERLARGHAADPRGHFYLTRAAFNQARARLRLTPAAYSPVLAAMLIYLNRTAFNGLFRLNADGGFNVPAGRYANPRIADRALIAGAAHTLAGRGVSIALAPFERVLERADSGDFLYFDPPYAPLSNTARFTAYTGRPFTLDDHTRLRDVAVALAGRGCHVMVSNSSADAIASRYQDPRVARSGLRVHCLPARRAINSRPSARGPVTEFLLTNLTARS